MGDKLKEIPALTGCFIAGTLVRVQRDLNLPRRIWKKIEDIQVGDLVFDPRQYRGQQIPLNS